MTEKLVDMKITDFVEQLASDAPAPGGGSASALVAGIGAALTRMVCELTVGKEKYKEFNDEMEKLLADMIEVNNDLLVAVDADTEAFNKVSAVFGMPRETEDEKAARREAMQVALKYATQVPYETLSLILKGLKLTKSAIGKSNPNVASDLGVAALAMKAGIQGMWLNVLINIGGVKDEAFRTEYYDNSKALLAEGIEIADHIYEEIEKSL